MSERAYTNEAAAVQIVDTHVLTFGECRLSQSQARLLEAAARGFFAPWGIDFRQYFPGTVHVDETGVKASVTWRHRENMAELVLTEIYWQRETGEILQAGSNYGRLSF